MIHISTGVVKASPGVVKMPPVVLRVADASSADRLQYGARAGGQRVDVLVFGEFGVKVDAFDADEF